MLYIPGDFIDEFAVFSRSRCYAVMSPTRQKFLIITINHSGAGFFAYVNFALNQLVYAERHNFWPVVYFGPKSGDGLNAYYDAHVGENMWDYYFEPVSTLTYANIEKMIADPNDPLTSDGLTWLSTGELWQIHEAEPCSVYPYPHGIYADKLRIIPNGTRISAVRRTG